MPTPECKTELLNQLVVFVTAVVSLIVSPALWGGLLGAAFGISFGKRVNLWWQGVSWLAFGIVVSVLANNYVVAMIDNIGAGFAAFSVAFSVTYFKESLLVWFSSLVKSIVGGGHAD